LIAAMPAAADAPVRKLAGSGQNIGGMDADLRKTKQRHDDDRIGNETRQSDAYSGHQKCRGDVTFSLHRR